MLDLPLPWSRPLPRPETVAGWPRPRSPACAADSGTRTRLVLDAGVEHLRLRAIDSAGTAAVEQLVPNHGDLRAVLGPLAGSGAPGSGAVRAVITGRLAGAAQRALGGGRVVAPAAALWLAAQRLVRRADFADVRRLAVVDLSASGYLVIGIDRDGKLVDDLLVVNPRCGAGSGINLDRVLQKLGVPREGVDDVLAAYCGDAGRAARTALGTRADRCGVFASSATISDKNQGIPLDVALATTLASEVLKTCRKLPAGFDAVVFAGRIFRWRFARDCAEDHVRSGGTARVEWDPENTHVLDALAEIEGDPVRGGAAEPVSVPTAHESFGQVRARLEAVHGYLRLPSEPVVPPPAADLRARPVVLALDVGSTMAKAVLADAADGTPLFLTARGNAGDTIETVRAVLRELDAAGVELLRVRGIGVTGSARYQVGQALARIFPEAADRISLLVENYAHARGSIDEARRHVERVRAAGAGPVDPEFCVLVDIGGEDTKVSTIALRRGELFANAMNLKCSAGTGSLMDTLAALFGIPGVAAASAAAYAAPRAPVVDATCAVLLMESARKLQADGVPRDEILASASWAVVENMARTLWGQVELPRDAVVLLHGQTMLSDPLPLAVADRIRAHVGGAAYAVVPPHPGHRACFGLVRTMLADAPQGDVRLRLADFLGASFEKRIVQCRGAACGDERARCNRTSLTCRGADGARVSFLLGGCTAVNELVARKRDARKPPRDAYREIWNFLAAAHPRSEDPRRLVIPRSFCVAEWALLLATVFRRFGIPVHVDDVRPADLVAAQGQFRVDACAPLMGAVGQLRRLAGEPHGLLVVPQIESLPADGAGASLTCTTNQGGLEVARNLASLAHPAARFHTFAVRMDRLDAGRLADQFATALAPAFAEYGVAPGARALRDAVQRAIDEHRRVRLAARDLAADLAEEALAEGRQVALVVGREYVLTPEVYDSSVHRLLRDRGMAAIPSYVLDLPLASEHADVYWRNARFVLTVLEAAATRTLHRRVRHPRLAEVFRRIESRGPDGPLLPVVQVSTFCCGPDSVIAHTAAAVMRSRPFLVLQTDAVLKELAHLENRVNTYVKQLELGLHGELRTSDGTRLEVARLGGLEASGPVDCARDVLYVPTLSDNRCVTSVLRAAGLACIDNWDPSRALRDRIAAGRRATGDSVCAPLAAVYGDFLSAVDDFVRRHERGDPQVAGRTRLLYFDNRGGGPCRQGLYAGVHQQLARRTFARGTIDVPGAAPAAERSACGETGALLRFLVAREEDSFDFGLEPWAFWRAYQGLVLQGVLHAVHFAGGAACGDATEYERFVAAWRALCDEVYGALESFRGPGRAGRALVAASSRVPYAGVAAKYLAYRLDGRDLAGPLARFAARWVRGRGPEPGALRIGVSGEVYMRVAQGEDVFRTLLGIAGHRRFRLELAPLWAYLEYLPEERVERATQEIAELRSRRARATAGDAAACDAEIRAGERKVRDARTLGRVIRHWIARPLYRAAGVPMPPSPRELLDEAREVLPTLRPHGELALYVGEALHQLRGGADVFLSVAPSGCMVTTMGEVLTPRIERAAGAAGRIRSLFSSDGTVDADALSLALLEALGPSRFVGARRPVPRTASVTPAGSARTGSTSRASSRRSPSCRGG